MIYIVKSAEGIDITLPRIGGGQRGERYTLTLTDQIGEGRQVAEGEDNGVSDRFMTFHISDSSGLKTGEYAYTVKDSEGTATTCGVAEIYEVGNAMIENTTETREYEQYRGKE